MLRYIKKRTLIKRSRWTKKKRTKCTINPCYKKTMDWFAVNGVMKRMKCSFQKNCKTNFNKKWHSKINGNKFFTHKDQLFVSNNVNLCVRLTISQNEHKHCRKRYYYCLTCCDNKIQITVMCINKNILFIRK